MIDVVFMSMTGVRMFKYLIKDCFIFFAYWDIYLQVIVWIVKLITE